MTSCGPYIGFLKGASLPGRLVSSRPCRNLTAIMRFNLTSVFVALGLSILALSSPAARRKLALSCNHIIVFTCTFIPFTGEFKRATEPPPLPVPPNNNECKRLVLPFPDIINGVPMDKDL